MKNQEPFRSDNLEYMMIELLKVDPKVNYTIDMLSNLEVLHYFVILPIVTRFDGWHYFGNLPISEDHHIPYLFRIESHNKYTLYHPNGKRFVSEDELGDAVLAATIGDGGVKLCYLRFLSEQGLLLKQEEPMSEKEAPVSEKGARSFKKLRNEGPVNMNHEMFWEMISNSRKNSRSNSTKFLQVLTNEISRLPEEDIFEFEKILNHYLVRSYKSDLWATAYIINGGCSDDGFEYFGPG